MSTINRHEFFYIKPDDANKVIEWLLEGKRGELKGVIGANSIIEALELLVYERAGRASLFLETRKDD